MPVVTLKDDADAARMIDNAMTQTALLWVAAGVAVVLRGLAWITSSLWYPGWTPAQTARILVKDQAFGFRALRMGRFWGDRLLVPLRQASADFADLNGRNAFWIAELLAHNESPRSIDLSHELYQQTTPLAKLVGAIGLAAHDALPRSEFLEGGTLHELLMSGTVLTDTAPVELALVAAKYARARESVPCLLRILQTRPASYGVHACTCDALAAIGDERAAPALDEALRAEDFHALPNAFVALHALSGDRAIPLAIDRIAPEIRDTNAGFVVRELRKVTGKNYGLNQSRWKRWWAERASNGVSR